MEDTFSVLIGMFEGPTEVDHDDIYDTYYIRRIFVDSSDHHMILAGIPVLPGTL